MPHMQAVLHMRELSAEENGWIINSSFSLQIASTAGYFKYKSMEKVCDAELRYFCSDSFE